MAPSDAYAWGSQQIKKDAAWRKEEGRIADFIDDAAKDEQGRIVLEGQQNLSPQEFTAREKAAFEQEWGATPAPPAAGPSGGGSGSTSTPSGAAGTSGEVTGLQSAITFAHGSATAAERAAAQDEAAIAALQAGGTTGPAIAALQASMEQHTTNAGHYRAAASALVPQTEVREAYDANPGAGTKQFVTTE